MPFLCLLLWLEGWGCLRPMFLARVGLAVPAALQPLGPGCVLPGRALVPPAPVGASVRLCPPAGAGPGGAGTHGCASPGEGQHRLRALPAQP